MPDPERVATAHISRVIGTQQEGPLWSTLR